MAAWQDEALLQEEAGEHPEGLPDWAPSKERRLAVQQAAIQLGLQAEMRRLIVHEWR